MGCSFLRGCKYSLEKAKKKIDTSMTVRNLLPEFFSGWDPTRPEMQRALSLGGSLPLPGYDQKGRKVILIRPGAYDTAVDNFEMIQRASFMVSELDARDSEQMFLTGLVLLFDYQGFTFSHFTSFSPAMIKKLMPWLVDL